MTGNICKRIWMLAALLAVVLLLAPPALADGADTGADAIEIAPDGTVTLISGHIAGEGVSSVQFQLRTEGEVSFSFAGDIAGGYLTNCVAGDGTLDIYIAGTAPLMQAGYTSRVLGTVSPADKVQPVQSSLQYVYGVSVVSQNSEADEAGQSGGASDVRTALEQALAQAMEQFGGTADIDQDRYTADSWAAFLNATAEAERVLEESPGDEAALRSALDAFTAAMDGLVLTSRGQLEVAIERAEALDSSRYTVDSWAVLTQALAQARDALAAGDQQAQQQAREKLEQAIGGLVEYASADGSPGGTYGDGPDMGGGNTRSAPAPENAENMQQSTQTAAPENTADATAQPGPGASAVPATGDDTALLPWALVLCASAALLAALVRRRALRG